MVCMPLICCAKCLTCENYGVVNECSKLLFRFATLVSVETTLTQRKINLTWTLLSWMWLNVVWSLAEVFQQIHALNSIGWSGLLWCTKELFSVARNVVYHFSLTSNVWLFITSKICILAPGKGKKKKTDTNISRVEARDLLGYIALWTQMKCAKESTLC